MTRANGALVLAAAIASLAFGSVSSHDASSSSAAQEPPLTIAAHASAAQEPAVVGDG